MTSKKTYSMLSVPTATALCAFGLAVMPAPAQALPPASPNCTEWDFDGTYHFVQSNGWDMSVTVHPGTPPEGSATATSSSGATMRGAVNVFWGYYLHGHRVADLTIRWDGGAVGKYSGPIDNNGFVHGSTYDANNKSSTATWDSTEPLSCTAYLAPDPKPNPQPEAVPVVDAPVHDQPAPAPAPATATATVTSDVDVYPEPGGEGKELGILRAKNKVQLIGTCNKDDWCQVSGSAVPNGSGWVWGALYF